MNWYWSQRTHLTPYKNPSYANEEATIVPCPLKPPSVELHTPWLQRRSLESSLKLEIRIPSKDRTISCIYPRNTFLWNEFEQWSNNINNIVIFFSGKGTSKRSTITLLSKITNVSRSESITKPSSMLNLHYFTDIPYVFVFSSLFCCNANWNRIAYLIVTGSLIVSIGTVNGKNTLLNIICIQPFDDTILKK